MPGSKQLLIAYQNAVLKAQQEVEDSLVAFLKAQKTSQIFWLSVGRRGVPWIWPSRQYREGTKDFTTVSLPSRPF